MSTARLNVFQRLVRQWDALHPYNAAQMLRIGGTCELPAVQRAWNDALMRLGLGYIRLEGSSYTCQSQNGRPVDQTIIIVSSQQSLEEHISTELNRAFAEGELPFRPFLHQSGDSWYAGVIYHHWIADSVSIRLLVREWFLGFTDPGSVRRTPLRLPAGGYWRTLGPTRADWSLPRALTSSVRWSARMKQARRIPGSLFDDMRAEFAMHELPDGWVAPLHQWSRRQQVTLNDVFLAALAEACQSHMPFQRTDRRQDLAMGTIIDLRPYAKEDLSDTFGLFLGFSNVVLRPDETQRFTTMLQVIAAQNAMQKRLAVPQSSVLRIGVGLAAGRLLSRGGQVRLYRKRTPYAGGISNVNLSRSWVMKYRSAGVLDYIRVSPTGPMLPLVITPTTLGEQLHLGLTYRPKIVSRETVGKIVQQFTGRLESIVQAQRQHSLEPMPLAALPA